MSCASANSSQLWRSRTASGSCTRSLAFVAFLQSPKGFSQSLARAVSGRDPLTASVETLPAPLNIEYRRNSNTLAVVSSFSKQRRRMSSCFHPRRAACLFAIRFRRTVRSSAVASLRRELAHCVSTPRLPQGYARCWIAHRICVSTCGFRGARPSPSLSRPGRASRCRRATARPGGPEWRTARGRGRRWANAGRRPCIPIPRRPSRIHWAPSMPGPLPAGMLKKSMVERAPASCFHSLAVSTRWTRRATFPGPYPPLPSSSTPRQGGRAARPLDADRNGAAPGAQPEETVALIGQRLAGQRRLPHRAQGLSSTTFA